MMGDSFTRLAMEWSPKSWIISKYLIVGGLLLITFSLVNPQWGTQNVDIKSIGTDVYIALDISNSMLADDIAPNRLEKAKRFLGQLLEQLKGHRVGLIFFAGGAYLQMPLSADLSTAGLLIKSANPDQAGNQGTAIGESIDLGLTYFDKKSSASKAIILITDGETHDEETIKAADKAKEQGCAIFAIGVGSRKGGKIPVGSNSYKLDENGGIVTTKLNEEVLQDIAEITNGKFFLLDNNANFLAELIKDLKSNKQEYVTTETYSQKGSRFQIFLGLGILLLIIGWVLPKTSILNRKPLKQAS
jgi:Ca-activated chloride channel family protein